MKSILQRATSLAEARSEMERTAPGDWLDRSIAGCLASFLEAGSSADRCALLRELVRLCGGVVSVPRGPELGGLGPQDLARFGVRAGRQGERVALALESDLTQVDKTLLDSVLRSTEVDPHPRRPYPTTLADGVLRRLTDRSHYRTPTQKAAARAALMMPPGGSLLVTMPTGAGKSLIFQLATLWWIEGTAPGRACSVVVVPTVSLALDHERTARGIPGLEGSRALAGHLGAEQYQDVLNAFRRGEVPLLFVSPEAALGRRAREAIREAALPLNQKSSRLQARLMGLFVDEVHIVESWGRSFRPDFQRLPAFARDLREMNPKLRVVLLSATVSDSARRLLEADYGCDQFLALSAEVARYEFDWVIHRCQDHESRERQVLRVLDILPRPAIVYTTRRDHAEALYRRLRERGYRRLALFTGDTAGSERDRVISDWAADRVDLVVATSAFGMGIDKTNVRAVVHACLPENASRYYQEVGRGGRDGHQTLALCLWCPRDLHTARGLTSKEWLTPDTAGLRWKALVDEAVKRGGLRDEGGGQVIRAHLDAAHQGLSSHTGGKNREWNRNLLNLLQRARAIEILSVAEASEDGPVWEFRVLDHEILRSGDRALSRVMELRDAEQREADQQLKALRSLVERPGAQCLLAALFELVEAGEPMAPYCGRCEWCLAQESKPPERLDFGGLDRVWPARPPRREIFPSGISIIQSDSTRDGDLPSLLPRLLRAGLQQFVVPDGKGEVVLGCLEGQGGLGLVLEFSMLLRETWAPAEMPTAVLFVDGRPQNTDMMRWVRKCAGAGGGCPWVLVAPPGVRFERRPLSVLSPQAPYDESQVEALTRKEKMAR